MVYPEIKFLVDKKIDIRQARKRTYRLDKLLGKNLQFLLRPEFAKSKRKFLIAYVNNFYKVRGDEITANLKETETKWQCCAKSYYKKVDKVFHCYPWPNGHYIGIISIWFLYPRYIDKKTFTFPLKNYKFKDLDLRVIAHEMLHFITYDYLQKKYGLKPSERNDRDNSFWQFTENLNVLIENSPFWNEFSGEFRSRPYEECRALYRKMEKIWKKNKDLDNLIIKIFGSRIKK